MSSQEANGSGVVPDQFTIQELAARSLQFPTALTKIELDDFGAVITYTGLYRLWEVVRVYLIYEFHGLNERGPYTLCESRIGYQGNEVIQPMAAKDLSSPVPTYDEALPLLAARVRQLLNEARGEPASLLDLLFVELAG